MTHTVPAVVPQSAHMSAYKKASAGSGIRTVFVVGTLGFLT